MDIIWNHIMNCECDTLCMHTVLLSYLMLYLFLVPNSFHPFIIVHYRLSYHYTHAHGFPEKEILYKIKSAEKVLPLGYYDDVYGYLDSAASLANNPEELKQINNLLEVAIFTIAASGPRSARAHRRPSLDPTLDLSLPLFSADSGSGAAGGGMSAATTPRTAAHIAELPSKFYQLESFVQEKLTKEAGHHVDSDAAVTTTVVEAERTNDMMTALLV